LMRLLARQDPHPRLFDAYAQTLPVLAAADDVLTEAALRAFELVLLREVGVLPTLNVVTLDPRPVRPAGQYRLQAEAGVVPDDGDPTHASLPALTGERLMALQAGLDDGRLAPLQTACLPALAALKGVLRPLLHYHLGQTPLRTRQVMRGVHTLAL
jgi:DNA repair protein RecO (recombination protein O)